MARKMKTMDGNREQLMPMLIQIYRLFIRLPLHP